MHNMSNRFYRIIIERLMYYFFDTGIQAGDKYYIEFENKEQIENLYNFFREREESEPFIYSHEQGTEYKSYYVNIGNTKLIVAGTIHDITSDYLVTLRNLVSEQNKLKGYAILFLFNEELDSLKGGAANLQKEGMPLSVSNIKEELQYQIKQATLSKVEKISLEFYLEKLTDNISYGFKSVFEFQDILTLISMTEFSTADYNRLGLFPDLSLPEAGNKDKMFVRLAENNGYYEKFIELYEYGNVNEGLEKFLDEDGIKQFKQKGEDWGSIEFEIVRESHENYKVGSVIDYNESNKKLTQEKLIYWERGDKEQGPGARKRNIIVFNPDKLQDINISFGFDGKLYYEYITSKKTKGVTVSGTNLNIYIEHNPGNSTFREVSYKHKNQSKSAYSFKIAVLECQPESISKLKSKYFVGVKEKSLLLDFEERELLINDMEPVIDYEINESCEILLSDTGMKLINRYEGDDDKLNVIFTDKNGVFKIPLRFSFDAKNVVSPITAKEIWSRKYELQDSFKVEGNKLIIGGLEKTFKETELRRLIDLERVIVEKEILFGEVIGDTVLEKGLVIDEDMRIAYLQLLKVFRDLDSVPSLTYITTEMEEIIDSYVDTFITLIGDIVEGEHMSKGQKNLLKIGTVQHDDMIYLTPFHPLNMAYQVNFKGQLGGCRLNNSLKDKFNYHNLVPYIYGEDESLLKTTNEDILIEWALYKPVTKVSDKETKEYLDSLVYDKIDEFRKHFRYLFYHGSRMPFRINCINFSNDLDILKGIIKYVKGLIKSKRIENIFPFEVVIYSSSEYENGAAVTAFEAFMRAESLDDISELGINLIVDEIDVLDVWRILKDNIKYYVKDEHQYEYAHISFYKMTEHSKPSVSKTDDIKTSVSLGGLVSAVSTVGCDDDFRVGFGTRYLDTEINPLIRLACKINELASNMSDDGSKPYRKGETIVTRIDESDDLDFSKLYEKSHWVTFVEPNFDLSYFDGEENLIIIHYSDQYTSSSSFDAITVTNKINQYAFIIREFLEEKQVEIQDADITGIVNLFNAINGEWLLNIIGDISQFPREKLSIISAVKHGLSYLYHEHILWVPISMEEILRVSKAIGLNQRGGVFTAKNLGVEGGASDDILMMGLENREERVVLHYYPIEVKIGNVTKEVVTKAKDQIESTYSMIRKNLIDSEEADSFDAKYYRNFFIQLLISAAEKMELYKVWPEQDYSMINRCRSKLIEDKYIISKELSEVIGIGAVIAFGSGELYQRVDYDIERDIYEIYLSEQSGYQDIIKGIEELKVRHLNKINIYKYKSESTVAVDDNTPKVDRRVIDDDDVTDIGNCKNHDEIQLEVPLEAVRVLIGDNIKTGEKVYWEFGHKSLTNRHLLISGTSGVGKTYCIQGMLYELSKQDISSIVFDYTEGFTYSKLDEKFTEALGDKVEQNYVRWNKLKINPFALQSVFIEGIGLKHEAPIDVATRISATFDNIYRLGPQQKNVIYEAVKNGLEKYGESMTFKYMAEEIQQIKGSYSETVLSRIRPFIDLDPFIYEGGFDWGDIRDCKGVVYVIQLTGYDRTIQVLLTDFILWDIWSYSMKNGSESKPLPLVLDEAQNLNHKQNSVSAKILTEGRKFGLSGWYATQFLKGQLRDDEIQRLQQAAQKLYFSPPEGGVNEVAKAITFSQSEVKTWIDKLKTLQKGQCVTLGNRNNGSKLEKHQPQILKITSMEERIKENKV
jgi:DNA phosphorothioation-dependent restriction protein DptH